MLCVVFFIELIYCVVGSVVFILVYYELSAVYCEIICVLFCIFYELPDLWTYKYCVVWTYRCCVMCFETYVLWTVRCIVLCLLWCVVYIVDFRVLGGDFWVLRYVCSLHIRVLCELKYVVHGEFGKLLVV